MSTDVLRRCLQPDTNRIRAHVFLRSAFALRCVRSALLERAYRYESSIWTGAFNVTSSNPEHGFEPPRALTLHALNLWFARGGIAFK